MLKKRFLKPLISIENLGKRKFWTGILIGVASSFVLSYIFNYSREALRIITYTKDFYILTDQEFHIYDLFFAAFSTSLGLGFTIIFWLNGRNKSVKRKYLISYVIANAWFIIFTALMTVSRFGSVLPIILYGLYGYDNHLNFLDEFWLLLILIPVYVFFVQWNTIRLIFRTTNWILFSSIFLLFLTFFLYKTTDSHRELLNLKYINDNRNRIEYINKEFEKARIQGIFFSESTNQILQKRYAERTINLVIDLKQAFNKNKPVELDTLILEKIVIHNMNAQDIYTYRHRKELDKNWSYAMPEEIYNQILLNDVNSEETKILFEILSEQISLFDYQEIDRVSRNNYTVYEREKSNFKRNLMRNTETIQSRLINVISELKKDNKYNKYWYLIPEFDFDDYRGFQRKIETD